MLRLLIIALASGFICAYVARQKGRNPLPWFLYGLVFPVISLVFLLLTPDLPEAAPSSRKRKCPHCAEMILVEARLCKHCGSAVEPAEIVVKRSRST